MIASALSITGLIAAAVAFVVLYVILSVPLWISLIVTAGVLVAATLISGGTAAKEEKRAHSGQQRSFG